MGFMGLTSTAAHLCWLLLLAAAAVPPSAASVAGVEQQALLSLSLGLAEQRAAPWREFAPISWMPEQLERMRRRALLQAQASGTAPDAPICELGFSFRPVYLEASSTGVSSIATITNNRELDMPSWQVVFKWQAAGAVTLKAAEGAIALSPGLPAGSPVRLVDPGSDVSIDGGGGTYSFFVLSSLLAGNDVPANTSLGIKQANLNGLSCRHLASSRRMGFRPCIDAYSPVDEQVAMDLGSCRAAMASGFSADTCVQTFCCGVVLVAPSSPSPPVPPSPPAQPPLPDVASPTPAMEAEEGPAAPSSEAQPGPDPAVPRGQAGGMQGGAAPRQLRVIVPVALGAAAGAALLTTGVWLAACQRRRARKQSALASAKGAAAFGAAAASPRIFSGCSVTIAPSLAAGLSGKGSLLEPSSGVSQQGGEPDPLTEGLVLHEKLGSGAFGVVYAGEWAPPDGGPPRRVAVKVMSTPCEQASRELRSFRNEVRVLSRLSHPRIARFLAASTAPPSVFIVEELAEGGSLHQLLHPRRRHRPLAYDRLLQVATDIAEGMCYLHASGVVHRDLKPSNVLLDASGRALVTDFGISRFKASTLAATTAGSQAGTPAYMAPEQFDSTPTTEKVDVFSFAVLCWECLTGRLPWREVASPMAIIYAVGCQNERLLLPESCPPALAQLVADCWGQEPEIRPSFPAILERLRAEQQRLEAEAEGGAGGLAVAPAAEGAPASEASLGTEASCAASGSQSPCSSPCASRCSSVCASPCSSPCASPCSRGGVCVEGRIEQPPAWEQRAAVLAAASPIVSPFALCQLPLSAESSASSLGR
eukprot:scaffold15.g4269.t1